MNINEVQKIADELIHFQLMEFQRKIIPSDRVKLGFGSSPFRKEIYFDPETLNFLTDDEVLWILLHEEGHLIFHQDSRSRESFINTNWFVLSVIFIISLAILFIQYSISFNLFYCIPIISVVIIIPSLESYISKKYFVAPYYNDEFRSDEYALKAFLIIRPDLVPWQVMYSSFKSLDKCREKHGKLSCLRKLYQKSKFTPHPPDNIRVQNIRELFNIYREIK